MSAGLLRLGVVALVFASGARADSVAVNDVFAALRNGSCCCCCSFGDNNAPAADPQAKAEVPPPNNGANGANGTNGANGGSNGKPTAPPVPGAPPTRPASTASPLALASLAAGRIDDVIVQLADDNPLAVRLSRVLQEQRRGADMRTAVYRAYGDRWATRAERAEILALLAGRDAKVRWRLSALAHADVRTDWPHGTATDAADAIRVELRHALPDGADDDGARGYVLRHQLRIHETSAKNALIEGTKMSSFELGFDVALADVDGAEIAHYASSGNVLGISEENAIKAWLVSGSKQQMAREIVDNLVGHILTDAEVSARKS